ncbi:potassium transporter TrkA [Dehalococcoides mccartyi CG4]|uniref:Trk system potassium transporter TrkA n=1 Tax=Dehalococcoides mccartyi TaxID=61435 RepID=UPI0004E05DC5|nr:Trk system potassium transporter TrkA [Dehalococcoides mccartyi]AII58821.1 potassium transporter TrkA [Dehalococcoides mccartyi CG4]
MFIVIAGGGTVGFNIASMLVVEDHEVVVIEQSETAVEYLNRQLDIKTIFGNAAIPRILRDAEVQRADLVLAVTDRDETNMVICFIAKEMGASTTAARIRNSEYTGYFIPPAKSTLSARRIIRPKSLGIDVFINPEVEMAREILGILSSFYSTPVEQLANGLVQIRNFTIEGSPMAGKTLSELNFTKPCVVASIARKEELLIPQPELVLEEEDVLYLVAERDNMDHLGRMFSAIQRPAHSVFILGGSQIGLLVAEGLADHDVDVKLIEPDEEKSQKAAIRLEKAVVLRGDPTDRDFLTEQGVPSADAFVATTENDEFNILSCLVAKNLGVDRSLSVINKPSYIPLAEAVDIDVAGSPAIITARKIAHFVLSGGAIAAALLESGQLEAVEFVVSPQASIINQKVNQLDIPKEAVIGAVVQNSQVIIPPDEAVIHGGDHVIVVSQLNVLHDVEKLFK